MPWMHDGYVPPIMTSRELVDFIRFKESR